MISKIKYAASIALESDFWKMAVGKAVESKQQQQQQRQQNKSSIT